MRLYEIYEHQAIKAHQIKFGHKTYHWKNLTLKILHDSGWPILCKDMKNWLTGKKEYGLDGLAFDVDKETGESIYYGIQVKYRSEGARITANDIGTFFDVVFNRLKKRHIKSGGFLYTNISKISPSLLASCNHGEIIRIIQLEFNTTTVSLPREITSFRSSEQTKQLRYYQQECLEALRRPWDGSKILAMICGSGKTSIYCTYASTFNFTRVIILSPTRLLANQNRNRFQQFIDDKKWISLLVDSDGKDSTRDQDQIGKIWNLKTSKIFISSTYYSARDILNEIIFKPQSHINSDKTLVIVDEAHNLTCRDIEILNKCKKWLLVTGTPPMKLQDEFETSDITNPWHPDNVIYSYPLRKAIIDRYITDYEIYLPLIEKTYPKENENYMKAQFLVEGMILHGCKKTIIYCNLIKECEVMEKHFKKAFSDFFPEDNYEIFTINSNISSSKRDIILKNFESSDGGTYKIILSVEILDEGLDIPKTDSIYITNPSKDQHDWKRMIQRMCRANRLDPDNPDKISKIFIWSPNRYQVHKCFETIKEEDPLFISKIRLLKTGIFEDDIDTPEKSSEFIESVQQATKELQTKWTIKCMTVSETRDYYLDKTEEYFKEHKKLPPAKFKIPGFDFGLGYWLCHVRRGIINLLQNQNERLVKMDAKFFTPKLKKINIDRIVQELLKFGKEKQRMPYKGEKVVLKDLGEINLGNFWEKIKSKKNKSFTDQHRQMILEVFPNAFDPCFIDKQELVDKFIEFEEKEGQWPLLRKDKIQMNGKEYSIGLSFVRVQRNPEKYLTKDLIIKLEDKDLLWRLNLTERTTLKKLEKCFEFYKKYHRWPKQQENKIYPLGDGETFDIGIFWNNVKSRTSISETSYQEILKLDSTFSIGKKRKREKE
jgi:superfamily II DNA or RNA helicase